MLSQFVNGSWIAGSGGTAEVINPFDASVLETVGQAGPDDVDRAVLAARAAFDTGPWRRTPATERAALLRRVADLLVRDKEEIARTETLDTGKTLVESRIDVDDVTAVFRYYADLADKDVGRIVDSGQAHVVSRVVHEPIGVCALITPWNYPLLQLSWKVAPAIVAGNTMVIKPSEVTPLTSVMLVRLLEEAGVPQGVVNIVLGDGPSVGAPLTEHPAVDMVSFTGGLATGQAIIRASAATVKRVAVELGGKNPNIVFADTDFETAVDYAITAVFLHSGQVCSAGARLIVQDEMHDDLVAEIGRRAERIRLGNGLDEGSEVGPLVSAAHRAKIEDYVASAQAEGARLVAGGRRPEEPELQKGFFYRPTVFADVQPRDARGPRGDVRPDPHRGALLLRGGGHRAGQRHRFRPRRCGVDRRHGPSRAGGGGTAARHGVDQRLPPVHPGGGVGRFQAVRQRSRARSDGAGRVPGTQAHLAQHRTKADAVVLGDRIQEVPR